MKRDLALRLAAAMRCGSGAFREEFLNSAAEVHRATSSRASLKASITSTSLAECDVLVRGSLLFNDLTVLSFSGGKRAEVVLFSGHGLREKFGVDEATIRIPVDLLRKIPQIEGKRELCPAYFFKQGDGFESDLREVESLVANNRLIVQPVRGVLHVDKIHVDTGHKVWKMIKVDPLAPMADWEVQCDEEGGNLTPVVESKRLSIPHCDLFEMTIPYLRGVPMGVFSQILAQEEDLISGLRGAIKALAKEVGPEDDLSTMTRDMIDPKVDSIARHLRGITRSHALKISGASIGFVAFTCSAIGTGGLVGGASAIAASGLLRGLLGDVSDLVTDRERLTCDPFYLLWRCKTAGRK